MRGIKIPQQYFALKMQGGGLCARGGGLMREGGRICGTLRYYSFILQDAAQGFHWNNLQATLHPFVAYFVDSGELCDNFRLPTA